MKPPIEIDCSQRLLLVVRFYRSGTDEEFRQYLADYAQVLEQEPRLGAVFVTAPEMPMTPPRHVRWQAEFIKQYREQIERRIVGVAFSLPSPLMRGVLRGVLMIQAMPCPHTVVGTEAEGVAWVKARLWTDHVRRMKSRSS